MSKDLKFSNPALKLVTPPVEVCFAFLEGGKYNRADCAFFVDPSDEAQAAMLKDLEAFRSAILAETKAQLDADEFENLGKPLVLKTLKDKEGKPHKHKGIVASMKKIKENKEAGKPVVALYDSQRNRLPDDTQIYPGTKARIRFLASAYSMNGKVGIAYKLQAIQVIAESSGMSSDDSADGFDVVEGGYVGSSAYEAPESSDVSNEPAGEVHDDDDF